MQSMLPFNYHDYMLLLQRSVIHPIYEQRLHCLQVCFSQPKQTLDYKFRPELITCRPQEMTSNLTLFYEWPLRLLFAFLKHISGLDNVYYTTFALGKPGARIFALL